MKFLAWDMTNEETCGAKNVNTTQATSEAFFSSYKSVANLRQLRRGCDGTPGLVGVNDACGVCQGDNRTCQDCNGDVNGQADLGNVLLYIVTILCTTDALSQI